MHNSRQHNAGFHNGGATISTAARHATKKYRLEIRTPAGALVAGLMDNWYGGTWTEEANAHGQISVSVPFNSTLYGQAAYPNLLVLRDQRGTELQRFQILGRGTSNQPDGLPSIDISGPSMSAQFTDEIIEQYEAGNEQQTITTTATGGTVKFSFRGQVTSALAYNVSTAALQTALEGLSTIGSGNVAVTGSAGACVVTFQGTLALRNVPRVGIRENELTGTTAADRRIAVTVARATRTVSQVVSDLLGFQVQTYPINYGSVSGSFTSTNVAVKFENKTLQECLLQLQAMFGGFQYVTPGRVFYWKSVIGSNKGQYVRIGYNGRGITEETDWGNFANRIVAHGAGLTKEAEITATVNDAASQSAYGIRPRHIIDRQIVNETDLATWAAAYLANVKDPRKKYTVPTIDIANTNGADLTFFSLEVGSTIKVVDAYTGISLSTKIARVTRNLDDPLDIEIEVTNPDAGSPVNSTGSPGNQSATEQTIADTVADIIADLYDQIGQDQGFEQTLIDSLPDALNSGDADIIGAIQNNMGGAVPQPYASTPERVSVSTGSAGSGTTYARGDHAHQEPADSARMYSRSDIATINALGGLVDGNLGYTEGNDRGYIRLAGTMTCFTHLE